MDKELNNRFPEVNGATIHMGTDPAVENGGSPTVMMVDEAGVVAIPGEAVGQQPERGTGGAEPSVLTAKEYVNQMKALPLSMRREVLGDDHERILEEILEQGNEVAVVENSKPFFDIDKIKQQKNKQ
jgi:hypothetical protein